MLQDQGNSALRAGTRSQDPAAEVKEDRTSDQGLWHGAWSPSAVCHPVWFTPGGLAQRPQQGKTPPEAAGERGSFLESCSSTSPEARDWKSLPKVLFILL